jgi:hypothetical protein
VGAEKLADPARAFQARDGSLPGRQLAQPERPDAAAALCTPGAGRSAEQSYAARAASEVPKQPAERQAAEVEPQGKSFAAHSKPRPETRPGHSPAAELQSAAEQQWEWEDPIPLEAQLAAPAQETERSDAAPALPPAALLGPQVQPVLPQAQAEARLPAWRLRQGPAALRASVARERRQPPSFA